MQSPDEHIARLKELVAVLPESPGVYQYLDKNGTIIYVGKAKRLKRRVSSYFNKYQDRAKVRILVRNIADIKHIVVDTEQDALLLENNLIKKYQPRYNSLLKDDKTYPWICVKNEPFPRIFSTRNFIRDGSSYFGPYTSGFALKTLLELIRRLYPIRTCALNLSRDAIAKGRYKICLEHHIGNCLGPCEGLQSEEDYAEAISNIKEILKGNSNEVIELLKSKMNALSKEYKFEEAQKVKNKIDKLSEFQSKSTVVSPTIHNVDVFAIYDDDDCAYISFMKVVNGAIVQVHTFEMRKRIEEELDSLLLSVIEEARQRRLSTSAEIIVPFEIDFSLDNINFVVPQRGDKKKLLELCEKNAHMYAVEKLKRSALRNRNNPIDLLVSVQKKLHLPSIPRYIEIFDNSNIQGAFPVAACVVYKDGKPSKKDYRLFNIKTVEGPDDYASMFEVVNRRYSRLMAEAQPLPDLIVADGGVGQMESIRQATEDALGLNIPILGLAKNDKHSTNELLIGFPPKHIEIRRTDDIFRFFAGMQEEVHRAAITFHRNKRSKAFLVSELDGIKGIGDKTKEGLFGELKTVDAMRAASLETLEKIIGHAKAVLLRQYFDGSGSAR